MWSEHARTQHVSSRQTHTCINWAACIAIANTAAHMD
jgi:hypothetical protein